MTKSILAWHFLKDDGGCCYGDGKPRPGGIETVSTDEQPLKPCCWGLHASRDILDALGHAGGHLLRRVELSGKILEDYDKMCATKRRELWRLDATNILHEFACWCMGRILNWLRKPVPRLVDALEAKRAWLRGEISNKELIEASINVRRGGIELEENDLYYGRYMIVDTILFDGVKAARVAAYFARTVISARAHPPPTPWSECTFTTLGDSPPVLSVPPGYLTPVQYEEEMQRHELLSMIKKERKKQNSDFYY